MHTHVGFEGQKQPQAAGWYGASHLGQSTISEEQEVPAWHAEDTSALEPHLQVGPQLGQSTISEEQEVPAWHAEDTSARLPRGGGCIGLGSGPQSHRTRQFLDVAHCT
eukprot:CAMPEP_0206150664 /NCGR_PEP_ID=MMETSP1473-20131121/38408_1 /ASSEMBLY_ACC=CAM_ASM_001109 /TAXON_ID=1461547 /ORGANISM="Stichococcus sp, Strain RCC1054" /LENGTH=107 /DNA_ID=CAMNT_0053548175 /DNA_START=1262 /DNA_END=1585 /DNA_ORIENTATION=-